LRLVPLSEPLVEKARLVGRKVGIKVPPNEKVYAVLLLGDGDPDDLVVWSLSRVLNEECSVGLIEPREKGSGSVRVMRELRSLFRVEKFGLMLDQERRSVEGLWKELSRAAKDVGIRLELVDEGERWARFSWRFFGSEGELIVVVNGLDLPMIESHKIEDHLLKIARDRLGISGVDREIELSGGDPKKAWRGFLRRDRELIWRVLREISEMEEDEVSKFFNQHLALRLLCEER